MNKTERLSIKVLPSDKALLVQIARAEGESAAVIVRRLIRRAASEMGFTPGQGTSQKREGASGTGHSSGK